MDWALAIERNRVSLLRIVAVLFGMTGLGHAASVDRITRPLHRTVLAVLRPAEAAVRRLIVVAARGLVVTPQAPRAAPPGRAIPRGTGGRIAFRLFDPPRHLPGPHRRFDAGARGNPRIRVIDVTFDPRIPLFRPAALVATDDARRDDDHTVNAVPLCRRLAAIRRALEDLPRQARRYARWLARPVDMRRPKRLAALRSGPPPGLHRRPTHEVEEILAECHWLARHAAVSDTS